MSDYERIDLIYEDLIKNGSDIPYLYTLRKESFHEIRKDLDIDEVLTSITEEIEYYSHVFLDKENEYNTKLISGFSTGIYMNDDSNFEYTLVGGNRSRSNNKKVDFDTVFDVASITKLYTLLLVFKLEELGLINLDETIKNVNPKFQGLGDFTFNDLIKLYGELRTDGNITQAKSIEEATEIFKTLYLVNDDRTNIKYNDFGSMVISDTIEHIVSQELGEKMGFDEIMQKYLLEPLGIRMTFFRPKTNNVSGNGYSYNMPHDPKSRALGGVCGHAGIFTTSGDLMLLAEGLFSGRIINEEHLNRLCKGNIDGARKGNMGLYLKHKDGYKVTFNPQEFSKNSFTAQGWTGSLASFDLYNKIHNSILVNAIVKDESDKLYHNKPIGFSKAMDEYQMQVIKRIILLYVVKKYYNKYCNVKKSFVLKKVI